MSIVSDKEVLMELALQVTRLADAATRIATSLEVIQHVLEPSMSTQKAPEPFGAPGNDPDHPWHWADLQYIDRKDKDRQ